MVMSTRIKWVMVLLLAAVPCWSQNNAVRELLQSLLSGGPQGTLPSQEVFFSTVNENTLGALSPGELATVLPLARQCLQSPRPEVRQYGLILFLAVTTRADSAKLLDSYIDDMGSLLDGPEGARSLRHGALYVLGGTQPKISARAAAYLNTHLDEARNSNEETRTIAVALLQASPSDTATLRKVLSTVNRRADTGLSNGVIRQLGLMKTRQPEALAFLESNLNHPDTHVRESAVDAVLRLDPDMRSRFANPLARIAADPDESEQTRSLAKFALQR
jgi:hypothetical protein